MEVSVAEAKNRFHQLLRAVEQGEQVIITRNGKPVAQLSPPPASRRRVQFGTMRGKIDLQPGWDAPIGLDRFLNSEL